MPLEIIQLALDKSMREIDINGFMRVKISNISKANVCPYRGCEIPGYQELGLFPDHVYFLLRDPAELALGAATFNSVPLLDVHVAHSAQNLPKANIVGSTGNESVFNAPYLQNSIVVWDALAINEIDKGEKSELSCGYRYRADMTPGVYDGVKYDGVMREIQANHVALVSAGRAGRDVIVADRQLQIGEIKMVRKLKPVAAMLFGMFQTALRPRLAADAAMPDIGMALDGVTKANLPTRKAKIVADVVTMLAGKMAKDATPAELLSLIDSLDPDDLDDMDGMDATTPPAVADPMKPAADAPVVPPAPDAMAGDPKAKIVALLSGAGMAADMIAQVKALLDMVCAPAAAAVDTVTPAAMDAALLRQRTELQTAFAAKDAAEREVLPVVGQVFGMDSAESVFGYALQQMGVSVTEVPKQGYGAMFRAIKNQRDAQRGQSARIAQDAAIAGDAFAVMFPTAMSVSKG